ncbi:hypothetical protein GXW82_21865 [Streptacidiphilus sp. 4-A2]|nr:hypothetical protein [Streptacidiphilus sp. 4-A2]
MRATASTAVDTPSLTDSNRTTREPISSEADPNCFSATRRIVSRAGSITLQAAAGDAAMIPRYPR